MKVKNINLSWFRGAGESINLDTDMKNVVVMEERPLGFGYTHELSNKMFVLIRTYYMRGNKLVCEDGGTNDAFVKWLKKMDSTLNTWSGERSLKYEEWDPAGVNKLNSAQFIMQNGIVIWVDELRFEVLSKMIKDLHWDPKATEPKLFKDPAASPHALDGFLHATSKLNRLDSVIEVGRFY